MNTPSPGDSARSTRWLMFILAPVIGGALALLIASVLDVLRIVSNNPRHLGAEILWIGLGAWFGLGVAVMKWRRSWDGRGRGLRWVLPAYLLLTVPVTLFLIVSAVLEAI